MVKGIVEYLIKRLAFYYNNNNNNNIYILNI